MNDYLGRLSSITSLGGECRSKVLHYIVVGHLGTRVRTGNQLETPTNSGRPLPVWQGTEH